MKQEQLTSNTDTIVALATPPGTSAIAVVRLSGPDCIEICDKIFFGAKLTKQASHTLHFGTIRDGESIIDEVLVSIFIAPKSFTRENSVEISTHGSAFIVKKLIQLLLKNGARLAKAGEFTKRAFLNGAFDLAQAEAVADLIASDTEASHQTALKQMRGGFSNEIKLLREELIHFASMIELELDFGEEDVEFASRDDLKKLIYELLNKINKLVESFDLGNVIKNGVPTVIAGKPNTGKSTLLNALLKEEKAIVSNIAGTTRDFIEDEVNIEGVIFRFIDTAGLRDTEDTIEAMGVERTRQQMEKASLILYMFDLSIDNITDIGREVNKLENLGTPFIKVANKTDKAEPELMDQLKNQEGIIYISALNKENVEKLKQAILEKANLQGFKTGNTIVTNARHYDSLVQCQTALQDVISGIDNGITNDFLALDIRTSLHHLGEITGDITTDDLLANIFSKFCIGK